MRQLFEDAVDHNSDAHIEAHRALRFYNNTDCEGQWDADDLRYLRDQMRMVLSFNVIRGKVDTMLGMYDDAQRTPVVASANDRKLAASVLDAIKTQVLEDANYQTLQAAQLKTGIIAGSCSIHIEVEPSTDGPDWVKVNLYRVMPFEEHWDISSIQPDRSDARYVFWDRWLSKSEFKSAYPEHAADWGTLSKTDDSGDSYSALSSEGEFGFDSGSSDGSDYSGDRFNRYYYDRRKGKIRVIRYEYKEFVDKVYAINLQTKQKTEIDKGQRERIELAHTFGMGLEIEIMEAEEEVVKVCEFAGREILAEYDEAGPFSGFSIVPFCFDIDEETGTSYGLIRNLFDPQMELNKAKSLEIEYLAQSAAPGVIAEEGAIDDHDAFMDEYRRAGGVAQVAKNALVTGTVKERAATPPSPAIMARMEGAMRLMDEVSTIPSSVHMTAAEHGQGGVVTAIRYNKQRQSVSTPFGHHEDAQKRIVEKICQVVVQAMPDTQIETILNKEGKYRVEGGYVIEMEMDPEQPGQMVPVDRANLRDMRSFRYSFDMEHTSENSTLRKIELEMLMAIEAVKPGMVDPEVMIERVTESRSTRERLKAFVVEAKKAAAAGAQAQQQSMEQQAQQFAAIEMANIEEKRRHNMASESLTMSDQQIKERLGLLSEWQDADENEKARIFEMAKFAVQTRGAQMNQGARING